MIYVILWLIQDWITVISGGDMWIPGIYMLGISLGVLVGEGEEGRIYLLWVTFIGGIMWDLRWVGIPGIFTLGYVVVVLIVMQVWGIIPPQGRVVPASSGFIVFTLLEASQIIPPFLPVIILGGSFAWRAFLRLQALSCPLLGGAMYWYFRHVKV